MKRRWEFILTLCCVGLCIVGNGVMCVEADEIDNALRVEDLTEGTAGDAVVDTSALSRGELEAALAEATAEVERLKDIVRRILVANRREKGAMQYNIGCVYRAAGHYKKAEEAFLAAARINPNDPAVHYNLGILYDDDLEMPHRAKKHYQLFLDLAPDDADAGQVYEWLTSIP